MSAARSCHLLPDWCLPGFHCHSAPSPKLSPSNKPTFICTCLCCASSCAWSTSCCHVPVNTVMSALLSATAACKVDWKAACQSAGWPGRMEDVARLTCASKEQSTVARYAIMTVTWCARRGNRTEAALHLMACRPRISTTLPCCCVAVKPGGEHQDQGLDETLTSDVPVGRMTLLVWPVAKTVALLMPPCCPQS